MSSCDGDPQELRGRYRCWHLASAIDTSLGMSPLYVWLVILVLGPIGALFWVDGNIIFALLAWGLIIIGLIRLLCFAPWRWLPLLPGLRRREWTGETRLEVQPDGFSIEMQEACRAYAWADFACWSEDMCSFVLIQPAGGYEFIPKSFFSSWRERSVFRQFLQARFDV